MDLYRWIVWLHVATGVVVLVTYWLTAFTRKGSRRHVLIGRIFMSGMCIMLATAAVICARFLNEGRWQMGYFFAYIVLLTFTAVWLAWRAPRMKRDRSGFFGWPYWLVALLNLGIGVSLFVLGLMVRHPLPTAFSWVGIAIGVFMLWVARRQPFDPRWWIRQHVAGVLIAGVATHIAFLNIGLTRLLDAVGMDMPMLLPWLMPLLVAGMAWVWLKRRHPLLRRHKPPAGTSDDRENAVLASR
jgi:MFS family permease